VKLSKQGDLTLTRVVETGVPNSLKLIENDLEVPEIIEDFMDWDVENEPDETQPAGWVLHSGTAGRLTVYSAYNGHTKVIKYADVFGANTPVYRKELPADCVRMIIEFDLTPSDGESAGDPWNGFYMWSADYSYKFMVRYSHGWEGFTYKVVFAGQQIDAQIPFSLGSPQPWHHFLLYFNFETNEYSAYYDDQLVVEKKPLAYPEKPYQYLVYHGGYHQEGTSYIDNLRIHPNPAAHLTPNALIIEGELMIDGEN
jgi:hypothetical protein